MRGLLASYGCHHDCTAWDMRVVPGCCTSTRACLSVDMVTKGHPTPRYVRAATIAFAVEGDTLVCDATLCSAPPTAVDAASQSLLEHGGACDAVALTSVLLEHCRRVCVANNVSYIGVRPDDNDKERNILAAHWRLQPCVDGMLRVAVPDRTAPLSPTVPLLVLLGDIRIEPATDDARKEWCQLVLRSCGHNLGGSEMIRVTWNASLRLAAYDERATPRSMVGMVCMTSDGWIPYVSAIGAEGSGLGSFLLFLALEWFRLTKGHTAGLSPSNGDVKVWYERWGFALTRPAHSSVPMSDQIMRRTIDHMAPLLPKSLHHYVPGVLVPRNLREPYQCVLCLGLLVDEHAITDGNVKVTPPAPVVPPRLFKTPALLRKHLESHHFRAGDESNTICSLMGASFGWPICAVCHNGFDVYECGACAHCWHAKSRKRKACTSTDVENHDDGCSPSSACSSL